MLIIIKHQVSSKLVEQTKRVPGIIRCTIAVFVATLLTGCEKILDIPQPKNTITTAKVFQNDKAAESALLGVYSGLANGSNTVSFTGGLSTILASASGDEWQSNTFSYLFANQLEPAFAEMYPIKNIWRSCYSVGIFGANSLLDALKESKNLTPQKMDLIEGEAKFIRAFSYFYLSQFFGEVPLVLETDFNKSAYQSKATMAAIYEQMIADLKDAQRLLPADYAINNGLRIRVNRWAATSLLARVYLYKGDYSSAAQEADKVIQHTALFSLMPSLNQVFLTNSKEAIWQLQHANDHASGNATMEGVNYLLSTLYPGAVFPASETPEEFLSPNLLNAFESGDKRKSNWLFYAVFGNDTAYFPYKYKTGFHNRVIGGMITEYYTPLRLAEQFLIRAEGSFKSGVRSKADAIEDVNEVRRRAGLENLPENLTDGELEAALEKEWQVEYFMEWGHRWFNLKRTGRATAVLSAIPYKQPWDGDRQLYYPIPLKELELNPSLTQHEAYK